MTAAYQSNLAVSALQFAAALPCQDPAAGPASFLHAQLTCLFLQLLHAATQLASHGLGRVLH
jgi:hypothetical protein